MKRNTIILLAVVGVVLLWLLNRKTSTTDPASSVANRLAGQPGDLANDVVNYNTPSLASLLSPSNSTPSTSSTSTSTATPAAVAPATYQNTGILIDDIKKFAAGAWAAFVGEQQSRNSPITAKELAKFEKQQVQAYRADKAANDLIAQQAALGANLPAELQAQLKADLVKQFERAQRRRRN